MTSTSTHAREAELLHRARSGETAAWDALYRDHHAAVLRAARRHVGPNLAEDLVAEAFTRTFALLVDGGGPRDAVRAYLVTAVRNLYAGVVRKDHRVLLTDQDEVLDDVTDPDPWHHLGDRDLVRAAFDTLPVRDRTVLWWTTVEGRSAEDLADLWSTTPQAVRQRAFRARESLRLAFLSAHAAAPADDSCRRILPLLSRRARGGLSDEGTHGRRVAAHVRDCRGCTAAATEISSAADLLTDVRRSAG